MWKTKTDYRVDYRTWVFEFVTPGLTVGWFGNLRSNRHTTAVKLARVGSSLKNQPYGFTNFFAERQHQHPQQHPQPFEFGAVRSIDGRLLPGNVSGLDDR